MPDEQGYSFDPKTGAVQEVEEERGGTGDLPDLGEPGGFHKSAHPEDQDTSSSGTGGWSEPPRGGLENTGDHAQDPMGQAGGGQHGG